ncbi:unnamed protein product, partial [Ectocarpus sp. 13 AM-2016]
VPFVEGARLGLPSEQLRLALGAHFLGVSCLSCHA